MREKLIRQHGLVENCLNQRAAARAEPKRIELTEVESVAAAADFIRRRLIS
ncbi:MAG: hypothetical protein R2911_32730 [Caldilineaceae bacterium]